MSSGTTNRGQMQVWCPLIPPDEIQSLLQHRDDLSRINETYDDWRASMRGKDFVSVKPGVFLDRLRILMINIGIACARNRELAESVQSIVSEALRKHALRIISGIPSEEPEQKSVKETLIVFFKDLKFTRDIYPIEEIRNCLVLPDSMSSSSLKSIQKILPKHSGTQDSMKKRIIERALLECTNVLKRLYIKLLSPDPWGTD